VSHYQRISSRACRCAVASRMTRNMESGFYLRSTIVRLDGPVRTKSSRIRRRSRVLQRRNDVRKKRASTWTEDVNSESNVKVAQVRSPKLRDGAKMEIRLKVNIGTEAGNVSGKSFLN
jgi:hypothetical protein